MTGVSDLPNAPCTQYVTVFLPWLLSKLRATVSDSGDFAGPDRWLSSRIEVDGQLETFKLASSTLPSSKYLRLLGFVALLTTLT